MSQTLIIRQAIGEDADQIHALHTSSVKALCKGHYSPEQIAGWLQNRTPQGYLPGIERGEMFVAVDEGGIAGFGHAIPGEVAAVFIAPEYTRHGIGRALLREGITRAQRGHQGVIRLEATLNAQEFYKKAGFVEVETRALKRNDVFIPVIVMELRNEI